jgi:hypothetical protein
VRLDSQYVDVLLNHSRTNAEIVGPVTGVKYFLRPNIIAVDVDQDDAVKLIETGAVRAATQADRSGRYAGYSRM